MKRIVVVADLHCGHKAGLTPPEWHGRTDGKLHDLAQECWRFYAGTLAALRPIDVLLVNGDAIDGKGGKSGGTELITTDRKEQADMAVACIEEAHADRTIMTFGTGYHAGEEEDWEGVIADQVNAQRVGSHEWLEVNGLIMDVKHHIGSSSIPHGRQTPLARARLWNLLWSERDDQPKANVYLRSHVHYHVFTGGADWLAMTTPALQAAATKYGARRCEGTVDYGLISFDVQDNGSYSWKAYLLRPTAQKAQALRV